MGWILSCIDRLSPLPEHPNFAVAMMPLGTGKRTLLPRSWAVREKQKIKRERVGSGVGRGEIKRL